MIGFGFQNQLHIFALNTTSDITKTVLVLVKNKPLVGINKIIHSQIQTNNPAMQPDGAKPSRAYKNRCHR